MTEIGEEELTKIKLMFFLQCTFNVFKRYARRVWTNKNIYNVNVVYKRV